MEPVNLTLLGCGTVGTGLVQILNRNRAIIEARTGRPVRIKHIVVRDKKKSRSPEVDPSLITTDADAAVTDGDVRIVVELMGGISPAREYLLKAIACGKHVVTANKALLSECWGEIFEAAEKAGVRIGFEASVAAGIPVIRSLRESFAANNVESIRGIINGTSNYILSSMTQEGREFQEALKQAQALGYAEADPTLDVGGMDATHKIAILASLAFGTRISPADIFCEGITSVTQADIRYAGELGYRIKPLAIAKRSGGRVDVRVHPAMLPENDMLAGVNGAYNAIYIRGDMVGQNIFIGKGAGALPTASAVASDMMEIAKGLSSDPSTPYLSLPERSRRMGIMGIGEVRSEYYIRLQALDRPGVLSRIAGVLGRHSISIESVIQKGREAERAVPLIMMTHEALEEDVQKAVKEIGALDVVPEPPMLLRVEKA